MVLRAITGVRTPACLSATSNPVEAVTPPFWVLAGTMHVALKELIQVYAEAERRIGRGSGWV